MITFNEFMQGQSQVKYGNTHLAGSVQNKENIFLDQLKSKAMMMNKPQKFKVLGDVMQVLFSDPAEYQWAMSLLRTQRDNMFDVSQLY